MALVPKVDRGPRNRVNAQVAMSGARSGVRASADDFGAGVGRALGGLANTGMQVADQMAALQEKEALEADEAAAKDAAFTLMKSEMDVVGRHTELVGRAAFENKQSALDEYQTSRAELMKSLGSERARKLFDEGTRVRGLSVQERIGKHASVSLKGWQSDQSKVAIGKYADDAVQFGVDGREINTTKIRGFTTLGVEEITDLAAREGWPPIVLQQAVEEHKSGVHNGIISRLVGLGDYAKAQKYYTANKDQVSGAHRGRIEAVIKDGKEKGAAIKAASDIWSNVTKAVAGDAPRLRMSDGSSDVETEGPTADDNLELALREIDKIGDPEKQQKVRSNILQRYKSEKVIEENRVGEAWKTAQDLVAGGGNPEGLSLAVKKAIGPARMHSLRGLYEADGKPITTREGHALLTDLLVGDPVKSAKVDLRKYAGILSEGHMATAIKRQAAIKEAIRGGSGKYDPRNGQAMGYFKDVLAAAGITDKANKGRLLAAFANALDVESNGGKSHPQWKRVQEIADSITRDVTMDGSLYGTNQAPLHAVNEIDYIHDDEQAAIREVIGANATDEQVLRAWQIAHMRNKVTWKTGEKDGE